ncbi:hypothetical protein GCM10023149_43530 [Mucilaginibacter gynuensis]|uniref:6-bladed beta-propeller protein n=1 Tax=Mucilaginibacter gynuensis TaxID=1302236 RepID=A0ABP8H880_9SPHI
MKPKHTFIVLFSTYFLILSSCINSDKINLEIDSSAPFKYEIKVNNILDSVNFNSIVKEYDFIPLETNEKCRINDIEDIRVTKNRILVISNGVYGFDSHGKFKYAINKRGKSSGAFVKLNDVSVNNDVFYIYDNTNYRLSKYNVEDGHFIRAITLPYSVRQVQVINDTLFMNKAKINNGFLEGNQNIMISTFADLTNVKGMVKEQSYDYLVDNQLWAANGQIFWRNVLNNAVYKINSHSIENYISFSFGELSFSQKEIEKTSLNKLALNHNKIFNLSKVQESKQHILGQAMIGGLPIWVIYNKASNEFIAYKNVNSSLLQFTPTSQAVENDKFYRVLSTIEVNFMRGMISRNPIAKTPNDPEFHIFNSIKNSKNGDNPVIISFKLK